MISHDGATAGYRAHLEYLPELDLTISWLSNTSEFDRHPVFLIESVRNIFIKPKSTDTTVNRTTTPVFNDFKIEPFAGWYKNPRSGGGLKIYSRNNKIYATQLGELSPVATNKVSIGSSNNTFIFTTKKGKELLFISESKDTIYFPKVDSADNNEQILKEYSGEYYSAEAETTVIMKIKNGGLVWFQHPKSEFILTPTYKDAFDYFAGSLYFERNRSNNITGFKVSVSRARNVSFVKIVKAIK
jgi:hypothetical protein